MGQSREEALAMLLSMFEGMDKEIIVAVLEQCNNQTERSIDVLLSMSSTDSTPPPIPSSPAQPALHENAASLGTAHLTQEELGQMKQDELLALALQNELFVSEVRQNKDLTGVDQSFFDDLSMKEIKEKFSHLGDAAKTKLRELSSLFTKYKPMAPITAEAPNSTSDTASNNDTASNKVTSIANINNDDEEIIAFDARTSRIQSTSLLDDDDDEDEIASKLIDRRKFRAPAVAAANAI